jgi:hypothetical protein
METSLGNLNSIVQILMQDDESVLREDGGDKQQFEKISKVFKIEKIFKESLMINRSVMGSSMSSSNFRRERLTNYYEIEPGKPLFYIQKIDKHSCKRF